jgi:TIR domain/C-terminal of Roc, COR, domain
VLRANDRDDKLPSKINKPLAPDGVVTASSLKTIHEKAQAWKMLDVKDYPAEKRQFLLRLMDLFQLSYPLDDEERAHLVPTLLPLTPPAGTEEPEGADRVRIRYEFQVSYSHLDREWFAKLQPLLKFRLSVVTASVWPDHELKAGDRWHDEIRAELDRMDVFLCLVSNHFLASDYITKVEMAAAFNREKAGKTTIVPLLLCDMDERDIQHLKPFNPLPALG